MACLYNRYHWIVYRLDKPGLINVVTWVEVDKIHPHYQ